MTVFNAEEVKKCLEDVVGEDKEYALWLLEWAINKRSYDLEEHDKQIRAKAFDELKWLVIKSHCDEVHCHYCDDKPRSPKNTMCALSDLEEHFDKAIEQLRKQNK